MKLEEIKVGMTVFHPVQGRGEVTGKTVEGHPNPRIRVKFEAYPQSFIFLYDSKWRDPDKHLASHLYPEPVTVVPTKELEAYKELVKAQKEYIEYLGDCYNHLYDAAENIGGDEFFRYEESEESSLKEKELLAKIKQLKSLLNK